MTNNSVSVTLFHATWCGHCTRFMPEWERMKNTKNITNNIDFMDHEASNMDELDLNEKTINGKKIAGYPTIKISVNGREYEYDGDRQARDILNFIKEKVNIHEQKGGCIGINHVNGCNCARQSDALTDFTE